MSTTQQELVEFIREQYNVPVTVEQGGKHAKLRWTYNERDYTYIVTRTRTVPPRTQANIVADIRRMCGQPPEPPTRIRKTMEELMDEIRGNVIGDITDPETNAILKITPAVELSHEETYVPPPDLPYPEGNYTALEPVEPEPEPEPQPAPTRTWPVTVSCYAARTPSKNVVTITISNEIIEVIPYFTVQKLDEEHWQLRPGGKRVFRLCRFAEKAMFRFLDTCAPFGAMQAEAVDVDGTILIYVPLANRPPVQVGRNLPKLDPNRYKPTVGRLATPYEEANSDEYGSQLPFPPQEDQEQEDQMPHKMREREPAAAAQVSANAEFMQSLERELNGSAQPDPGEQIIKTTSLEDEMRQVLRKIRAIEDTTPYVLATRTRQDGSQRWVWQAPDIE